MKKVFTATAIGALLAAGAAIAMQTEPAAAPRKAPMTKAQALARADARFDALDTNKDGQLSAQERDAARPGRDRAGVTRSDRMLARIDSNGDGLVSRAEYRTAAEARFARVDSDKDGVIQPGERRGGKRHGMRGGRGGGMRMLMQADTNQDGRITRSEYDTWSAARFKRLDRNGDGKIDAADRPQRPTSPPSPPAPSPAPGAR